jgi:hypothetical protein
MPGLNGERSGQPKPHAPNTCRRGGAGWASDAAAEKANPVKKASANNCSLAWAALIRLVYEVDPLKCPKCGGMMKVISFIEQDDVIEKILKHTGLWSEAPARPPPNISLAA